MKKILARVMLATTIITGIGVAGARATESQAGCLPDQVCLYEDISFFGNMWSFFMNAPYVGNDANERASSVSNNTEMAVRVYREPNFLGHSVCLYPNSKVDDLSIAGLNDAISSIEIGIEPASCY